MKTLLHLVALFALFTLIPPAQVQADDTYVYYPNSEKCSRARIDQSVYEQNEQVPPKYILATLEKCAQYKKSIVIQEQPTRNALNLFR